MKVEVTKFQIDVVDEAKAQEFIDKIDELCKQYAIHRSAYYFEFGEVVK